MDDLESVLATTVELLRAGGNVEAANLMQQAEGRIEQTGHDNWNGGTSLWTIFLPITPERYAKLGDKRADFESAINQVVNAVIGEQANDWYSISITPQRVTRGDRSRGTVGVTAATRRNIIDGLQIEGIHWSGQLDEIAFLRRIWNLKSLPSGDPRFPDAEGDIWQHTVNNEDWENDWLYGDSRFDLINCPTDIFLKFLSESVHPLVRPDQDQARRGVEHFNDQLRRDGYELYAAEHIAGRPRYASRPISGPAIAVAPIATRSVATVSNEATGRPMYNLLMVASSGHWDTGEAEFDLGRFLEYTAAPIKARFTPLDDERVAALMNMPALFAYETQCTQPARVGRITRVRHRTNALALNFEFDPAIPPIPHETVNRLAKALDCDGWEQNRTHWAIKDVDLLQVLAKDGVPGTASRGEEVARLAMGMPAFDVTAPRSRVFVVHGRDDKAKLAVARFLERIGIEALILHEQPNAGRTLIVKFQQIAAGADFAVVLVTPDDVGGLDEHALKRRARQNVIFELGFFIGKLGPEKVCALVSENVEKPSDFDGVVYVPLASGDGWKLELARELKAAGIRFEVAKMF